MLPAVVAALLGIFTVAVNVDGTTCVEAADVTAALEGLLPGDLAGALAVQISPSADSLVVRVRNRDGELIAERALPALPTGQASCKERASQIAVVVAAAAVPEVPVAAPTSTTAVEPPALPASPVATVVAGAPQRVPRPFDVGVTAGASLAGGGFAPAARVEVDTAVSPGLWVRLGGLYDGEHREDVGRGQAAWSRWGIAGTLALRKALGASAFEVQAGAELAAAWREIAGRGFVATESSWAFDPGAGLDARLLRRGQRFSWWLAASAMAWPRSQQVFVRGIPSEGELSRWDLFAGIGGAFGRR